MSNYWEKKRKQKQKQDEEIRNSKGQTADEYKRGAAPSSSPSNEEFRNAYGQTYEEYIAAKEKGKNTVNNYDKWKTTSNNLIKEYDDYSYSGKYMTQEQHDDYYKRLNEQLKQGASMREKYGNNAEEINAIIEKMSGQVQDNYEGRKYYSQWDDDETYQQFLSYQKENEAANNLLGNDENEDLPLDFKKNSQYVAPKGLKSIFRDQNYEYINDTEWSPKYSVDGSGDVTEQEKKGYDYITDDERQKYNYIYNTQGKDEAKAYLEELNLTERMADAVIEERRAYAKEHPVLASAKSVAQSVAGGGLGFADSAVKKLAGKEIDPNSYANLTNRVSSEMREAVAEEIDSGAGQFLYQTGMSMADSVAAMAATAWTGPLGLAPGLASGFILGSNAATSAMLNAKERGVSDGQALATGIAQGAAEMIFEKWSLGNLSALKDVPVNSVKNAIGNVLKQAGIEGSEEVFTSIANSLTDALINGELSENKVNIQNYISQGYSEEEAKKMARKDYFSQLLMDFLGGALSGGVMSSGAQAINYMTRNQNAETAEVEAENEAETEDAEVPAQEEDGILPEELPEEIPWEEAEMYSGEAQEAVPDEKLEVAPAQPVEGVKTEVKATVSKEAQAAKNNINTILQYGRVDDTLAEVIVKNPDMKKALEEKTGIEITGMEEEQRNGVKEVVRVYGERHGSTVTRSKNTPQTSSEDARTSVRGRNVDIIGIQSQDDSEPKFKGADGKTYSYGEIDFKNNADRKLYAVAAQVAMDSNESVADEFINGYKPSYPVEAYSRGFQLLYNAGRNGVPVREATNAVEFMVRKTDMGIMSKAWTLGYNAREQENATVAVKKKRQKKNGKGTFEDQTRQDGPITEIARLVADRTGIDIIRKSGLENDANAAFVPSTMTLLLSENAQNEYTSLIHELGEFGLSYNRESMKQIQDAIVKYWAEKNGVKGLDDIDILVNAYQTQYKKAEGSKTREQAMDEIINDALGGLFSTETGAKEFIEWLQKDSGYSKTEQRTIIQRFIDALDQIVAYLKDLIKEGNLTSAARKAAQMEEQRAHEIRQMFLDVLEDAIETANTTGEYTTDVAIKNSLKDFAEQYDAWDGKNARTVFDVTVATDVYKFLGKDNKTIRFDASKIIKIKSKHQGMTDAVIKQIPEILNDPVLIMKSKKNDTRIVVTGMLQDENGKPVVIVLELEPTGRNGIVVDEIKIASAYGKDGMQNFINKSEVLYTNPNKQIISRWTKRTRLQLPVGKAAADYNNIVSDTQENATHEMKFSLKIEEDSEGNRLSEQQKEYFRNSKVRDESGNLKIMHHGTMNDFTVFNPFLEGGKNGIQEGYGIYFTDTEKVTESYGNKKMTGYLNITRPATSYKKTIKSAELVKLIKATAEAEAKQYVEDGDYDDIEDALKDTWISNYTDTYSVTLNKAYTEVATEILSLNSDDMSIVQEIMRGIAVRDYKEAYEFYDILKNTMGIDGFLTEWNSDLLPNKKTQIAVAFNSNQFKNIDNINPTDNEDVRYSLKVDIDEEISYFGVENKLNDYIGVQKAVLEKLDNENFYTDVVNEATGVKISIGRKGIKETLGSGKRFQTLPRDIKKLKIATLHSLPELLQKSVLTTDNAKNIHNMSPLFAYFESDIEINGEDYRITFDVKKTSAKNHFWIHCVRINEKDSALLTSAPTGQKIHETQNPSEKIVADEADDVKRFSLREDYDALEERYRNTLRENDTYKQIIDSLESKLDIRKGISVSQESVVKVADKMYRRYKSTYDKADFTDKVAGLFQAGETNKGNFLYIAEEIMRPVIKNSKDNLEISDYAKGILRDIRKTPIKLNEMQRNEAAYHHGTFNDYRKSLFGRVTFTDKGTSLDILWKQWSEAYPEWFDENISLVDQAVKLAEIINNLKEDYSNEYGFTLDDAVSYAAMELMNEYANLPEVKGMTDKAMSAQFKSQYMKLTNAIKKEYQEKYEKQIAELKKENAQAARKNRDRLLEQEAKFRARTAETRKQRQDRHARGRYMKNLQREVSTMKRWFESNSDKNHVPEVLKDMTMDFFNTLDFLSDRSRNKTVRGLQFGLIKLQDRYADLKKNKLCEDFYSVMDVDFEAKLQEIRKEIGRENVRKIPDMGNDELKELSELATSLRAAISNMNKSWTNQRFETISQVGEASVRELSELRRKPNWRKLMVGDSLLNLHMLDAESFFEQMGDAAHSIYRSLREGFDKRTWNLDRAGAYMKDAIGDTDISAWTGAKAELHKFGEGENEFEMTTAQLMTLYELSKRPQGMKHLESEKGDAGGFVVEQTKDGKKQKTLNRPIRTDKQMLERMFERLTPEQKELADKMQKFLAKDCADWGNEVTMRMHLYKKYGEAEYWPIKSYDNSLNVNNIKKKSADVGAYHLKNLGHTKNLNEEASNPVLVEDIFDVFTEHVANMANYNAFVLPLEDAMRWYNFKTRNADGEPTGGLTEEMERAFGKGAKSYFEKFIKDINGESVKSLESSIGEALTRNYKASAVSFSSSVVIQQPCSYIRAACVMNPKYLTKAAAMMKFAEGSKEATEYSAIAKWKSWGFFETNIGMSMKSLITGQKTFREKFNDAGMYLAQKADEMTLGNLWNAAKLEIADKYKDMDTSSEEYIELVRKRFDEVVDKTQVVDTVFHRSQIMRSDNGLTKMTTAFMTEPTKTYNLLRNTAYQWQIKKNKAAAKSFGATCAALAINAVATAAASAVVGAFRDDDEEKEWGEKWLENFWSNTASNIIPLAWIPWTKDIMSLLEGYDVSRMDMAGMDTLITALKQGWKYYKGDSDKTAYGVCKNIIRGISQVSGYGMYNILREFETIVEQFTFHPFDDDKPTNKTVRIRLLKAMNQENDKQLKKWLAWYDEKYQEKIAAGKTDKEARAALKSGITGQFKEIYQNSTTAEKIKIKQLLLKISVNGKQLYKDYDWSTWDKKKED